MFVFLDKSVVESHTSAITLSASMILCCGKDGQLRLFRNYYEVKIFVQKNEIHFFFISSGIFKHYNLVLVLFKV